MESEIYVGCDFGVLSHLLSNTGSMPLGVRNSYYKIVLLRHEPVISDSLKHKTELKSVLYLMKPQSATLSLLDMDKKIGVWCIVSERSFLQYIYLKLINIVPLFSYDTDRVILYAKSAELTIDRLFKIMLRESDLNYMHKYDLLFNCLALIFHEAIKLLPAMPISNEYNTASAVLQSFHQSLDQQFYQVATGLPLTLKKPVDFAAEVNLELTQLNTIVKAMTGKSVADVIQLRIVHESKSLLKNSDLNIAEIAGRLGFDYPAHFNTFFKKLTGVTPLYFRKTLACGSVDLCND